MKQLLKQVLEPILKTVKNLILKTASKPILKTVKNLILKLMKSRAAPAILAVAIAAAAFALICIVFYSRSPVLVVTDAAFAELYGKERIRRQGRASSFALFRRVKPVLTADGASPDILAAAASGAARRPYCVLFPGYLAQAAELYHQQFPEIRTVIIGGFSAPSDLPRPDGALCVYRTDLAVDMYRAGLFAGLIGLKRSPAEAKRTCFFWQDRFIRTAEREFFSSGLRESDTDAVARFISSTSDITGLEGISCVILTRSGAEFLEIDAKKPLILFTWLDPSMLPAETTAVFDDSAWALLVTAARMAVNNQSEGKIPSKPLVFPGETADNGIDRILKQLAKKTP
jgi:hypothetical protein